MCNHGRFTLLYHRPTQHCKAIFLQLKNRLKKKYFSEFCEPFWQIIKPERRGLEEPLQPNWTEGQYLRSACEVGQSCGTEPIIRGMWAKP